MIMIIPIVGSGHRQVPLLIKRFIQGLTQWLAPKLDSSWFADLLSVVYIYHFNPKALLPS